jgi:regulatory protein
MTKDAGSGSGPEDGPAADPVEVARIICLRQLTAGPRTRVQLATALEKRRVPEAAAAAVLDRLSEVGLIDDSAYASAWVDGRRRGRGLSRQAMRRELRSRGVPAAEAESAVAVVDDEQEERNARELVERKLAAGRSLEPATGTRRLTGMLLRRGYSTSLATRVIREALGAEALREDTD